MQYTSMKLTIRSTLDSLEWYFHRFVVVVFTVFVGLLPVWQEITDNRILLNKNDRFDYIIVGSGSAGSVLATRLAADPSLRILVLEAGLEKPNILNIPALGSLLQLSPFDWQYKTVPQSHSCFALKENRSRWPSGKVLGGSTHLNYMLHVPGHIKDFQTWKHPLEDDWNEEEIRYYFQRSLSAGIPTQKAPFSTYLSSSVLEAAKELEMSTGPINLDTDSGFSTPHLNMDDWGRRWTSNRLLTNIAASNPNVVIKTGATVQKVLINSAMEAYGVELLQGGQPIPILANMEVILSAGAIGSPHLLMLSGIGPRKVLKDAQISVKKDLPVGENLQDHVTTGLDLLLANKHIFSMGDLTSPVSAVQYFFYGTGPFTTALCEAVAIINSTNSPNAPPELELMIMMAGLSSDGGLFSRHSLGIKDKVWDSYFAPLVGRHVATILPVLLHPKSLGNIKLDANNPVGPPLINPNYLTHPDDVETLVDGLNWVYKLATTVAMRDAGLRMNRRPFPGCHDFVFGQRDYWRCYVRQLTLTSYHPVGTCRMGRKSESVVDHQLRVHGIANLRVVDASVMPTLPSGNTNAAVMMIAEKAADLITAEYRFRSKVCDVRHAFLPPTVC